MPFASADDHLDHRGVGGLRVRLPSARYSRRCSEPQSNPKAGRFSKRGRLRDRWACPRQRGRVARSALGQCNAAHKFVPGGQRCVPGAHHQLRKPRPVTTPAAAEIRSVPGLVASVPWVCNSGPLRIRKKCTPSPSKTLVSPAKTSRHAAAHDCAKATRYRQERNRSKCLRFGPSPPLLSYDFFRILRGPVLCAVSATARHGRRGLASARGGLQRCGPGNLL